MKPADAALYAISLHPQKRSQGKTNVIKLRNDHDIDTKRIGESLPCNRASNRAPPSTAKTGRSTATASGTGSSLELSDPLIIVAARGDDPRAQFR